MSHHTIDANQLIAEPTLQWRAVLPTAAPLAVFLLLALPLIMAQSASEYQVKAAYLFNFAKSTQWSHQRLPNPSSPLIIGVVAGDDEFIDLLKQTVAQKSVSGHPIVVTRANTAEESKACHLVFIRSSAGHKRTLALIASLASQSVLLVGEDDDFLPQGGMINLALQGGRVRFQVNAAALDRANLHLTKELLALAGPGRSSSSAEAGETRPPKFNPPPEYPLIAKRMHITGAVQLQITIRPDGTVKDAKVLGGHPALADAAVKAVMKWRYEPAAREASTVIRLDFEP